MASTHKLDWFSATISSTTYIEDERKGFVQLKIVSWLKYIYHALLGVQKVHSIDNKQVGDELMMTNSGVAKIPMDVYKIELLFSSTCKVAGSVKKHHIKIIFNF